MCTMTSVLDIPGFFLILYTCFLYVELEITVQFDNDAPVEGVDLMVKLCVVVSGINACIRYRSDHHCYCY